MDLKIQEMIKDKLISIDSVDYLPTNTCQKIDFLFPDHKLLKESYLWFLQNYHNIQREYEAKKTLTKQKFDKYEFDQCREILLTDSQNLFNQSKK